MWLLLLDFVLPDWQLVNCMLLSNLPLLNVGKLWPRGRIQPVKLYNASR